MSGADTQDQKIKRFLHSLPGKRGIDIPAEKYDAIHEAAQGETLPVWGRHPTPWQMQHLHDAGLHQPEQIKAFFGNLQHPHLPGVKVSEYPAWAEAYSAFRHHGKSPKQ